ncbi:uncharacterized protein LOC110467160 [Mizuhopecten yessoensis]|uniref:Uncharacterized protein n=1 Tax=Mizuhopecten yessoensis TaxID=6573 RepID=A0A210PMI4_MIZYE|nr:uncharacterized protein LOC110467160 [Mizuhopecten yessoensis]XP_021379797.1 uncharacterized protein LOC110467160 [Mizuhopecten yessoensis]OWF37681.1 hypothetical protein KP79_PYT09265 [Mizuhopecten yessoensis]
MNTFLNNNNSSVWPNGMDVSHQSTKRQRMNESLEDPNQQPFAAPPCSCGKKFLPVRKNDTTFITEDWRSTGTSLFKPLVQDIFVNLVKYEQFSMSEGTFFVADSFGNYSNSVTGQVLHMWRYDKSKKQLFIAQSILFTCPQDLVVIQAVLHSI